MEDVALYFSKGRPSNTSEDHILISLNPDIVDPTKIVGARKGAIDRFIGILMPILDLFQLPLTKIHIFYHLAGNTVTLNNNGSIFVNLGYYEGWRTYYFQCLCRQRSSGLNR